MGKENVNAVKPELVFADLPKGRKFPALEFKITPEYVREFKSVVGDNCPFYDDGPGGAKMAPPGLAAIYARLSYLQDHSMPPGGVLAKQEFDFLKPIKIGDTLFVNAEVDEQYNDEKNRKRVNFLIKARDSRGDLISEIRLYAIWPK